MSSCIQGWAINAIKKGGARCKEREKTTNILHEPISLPFKK